MALSNWTLRISAHNTNYVKLDIPPRTRLRTATSPASPLDLKPVNHRARYVKTGAQNPCGLYRIHVALPAYPLTSGHAQNVVQFSSSVVSFDRMELSCVVGDAVTVTGATSAVLMAEDE